MGKRTKCIIPILIFLLCPATTFAYSSEDLLNDYGIECESTLDPSVLSILQAYEEAKYHTLKYSGLLCLQPDTDILSERANVLEQKRKELQNTLDNGFHLTYQQIMSYESSYAEATKQLEATAKTLSTDEVDLAIPSVSVPDADEYRAACKSKDDYTKRNYLGEYDAVKIVNQYTDIVYNEHGSVCYFGTRGQDVHALFNATCTGVEQKGDFSTIMFNVGDYATLTYSGVVYSEVQEGDSVLQNGVIGLAGNSLSVQLKVNDTTINFIDKE